MAAVSSSPRNGLTSDGEQMERFRTYVRSLNEQFARWVVQQWETKADRCAARGATHAVKQAAIPPCLCLWSRWRSQAGSSWPCTCLFLAQRSVVRFWEAHRAIQACMRGVSLIKYTVMHPMVRASLLWQVLGARHGGLLTPCSHHQARPPRGRCSSR
jgi:hypothetical protein